MKNKVVVAFLSLIFIASVACNVYQYNKLNTSRQQLVDAQSQLNNMTNSYVDLDAQLTALQGELDALNINMADKQSEIDSLAKENSDLVSSISELEVTLEESKGVSLEEVAETEQKADATTSTTSTTTSAESTTTTDTASTVQTGGNDLSSLLGLPVEHVANGGAGVDMSGWSTPSGNWE